MIPATDLAWAAGFLDGDGHFCFTGPRKWGRGRIVIGATQVRREPLERLQAILGGKIWGPHKFIHRAGRPPTMAHQWSAGGSERVLELIELLVPWLSIPKRQQVLKAVAGYTFRRPAKPIWRGGSRRKPLSAL